MKYVTDVSAGDKCELSHPPLMAHKPFLPSMAAPVNLAFN